MQITIKSRNGKLNDDDRTYLEHKLQKLERYTTDGLGSILVEVSRATLRGAGETHKIQATLHGDHGLVVRAEEQDGSYTGTVDALHDHLQRQLTRYKERRSQRPQRTDDALLPIPRIDNDEAATARPPRLVRTKQFSYKPMTTDEAIEQMELLSHDFFVFTESRSGQVGVIYRRKDGDYGLIEQTME